MSLDAAETIEIGFAFVALERFKNKTFTRELITEVQKALGSDSDSQCQNLSADEAFQKRNSFLARLILRSENSSCDVSRIKDNLVTFMLDDKNSVNSFLRDQLQYKAPYLGKSFCCFYHYSNLFSGKGFVDSKLWKKKTLIIPRESTY